jgi:hypothetical protein
MEKNTSEREANQEEEEAGQRVLQAEKTYFRNKTVRIL